jgi:hypothetical protein
MQGITWPREGVSCLLNNDFAAWSSTDRLYDSKQFVPVNHVQRVISLKLIIIYLSRALQPFVGPWPLFQFLDLFTQSVGLLGRGISPSQVRYLHTEQRKHRINAHRHPFLKRDSNPRSQCSSGRRKFLPYTARPLWSSKINLYMTKTLTKD